MGQKRFKMSSRYIPTQYEQNVKKGNRINVSMSSCGSDATSSLLRLSCCASQKLSITLISITSASCTLKVRMNSTTVERVGFFILNLIVSNMSEIVFENCYRVVTSRRKNVGIRTIHPV
mmetsp:Transcript_14837/g.34359  ORF Transcript_14837/g.34359 Transcript_14837/m.34359 type:complete len:119 (+) Transcript_14837:1560-1916(+)